MTKTFKRAALAAALVSLPLVSACSEKAAEPAEMQTRDNVSQTVATLIGGEASTATLARTLRETGLAPMFDGQASYTVLAPTDAAFEALPGGESLLGAKENGAVVAAILRDHILPGTFTPEAIEQAISDNGGPVTMRTMGGETVGFALEDGAVVFTGPGGTKARLAGGAQVGSNGAVIPIDAVISAPPTGK